MCATILFKALFVFENCANFCSDLVAGFAPGAVVSYGQVNMQQIYTNDMYANSSQWNVKFGDPTVPGEILTRTEPVMDGNLYSCAGVDPSLSCFNNNDLSACVICSKSMAMGIATIGDWLRPAGNAAWLIDSLPFPHTLLSNSSGNVVRCVCVNTSCCCVPGLLMNLFFQTC